MMSDALYDADCSLYRYQTEMPEIYDSIRPRVDALRCAMIVLRLELDNTLPVEWLDRNPIYTAAKAGDVSPHDAFQYGEDDSVLEEYRRELAAFFDSQRS
ncbi:hypothetical protein M2360_004885 [Rhizobium sp. SG_E_25_P2]|uniref:hypothetical protein n=1 Tax=Rhizobium sp. SG_E_25_P2 TaxID=2879942 RepID=UPI002473A049|nr:hypothetical protein [Rhizobium sp. SG_E_25_P2]MDH6269457.1 hypothetical protein [Rhizobium sp. SG_E_25_P2]